MIGAVDFSECPTKKCRCGICRVCGFQKHMAVHGPYFDAPPGSKPYDHQFVAQESRFRLRKNGVYE